MEFTLKNYFEGNSGSISKIQEQQLMKTKNTGKSAEDYVESILRRIGIKFIKNKRIVTETCCVIPDFYLPEKDLIIEVKSRGYNCNGTSSEKIDNIPRKYSKIMSSPGHFNTKIVVVFCAYELLNKSTLEIIENTTKYSKSFLKLAKSFNVIDWISVSKLYDYLYLVNHKPALKWAGGKSKIKKQILEKFPEVYGSYYEPFIGGGAVGFSLEKSKNKIFSDINKNLILFYKVVKNKVEDLITELSNRTYLNNRQTFLEKRELFNNTDSNKVEKAALFLYLNKCCFNGLYRENKNGKFNVPFGSMKNPNICDSENLRNLSVYLQNIELLDGDFKELTKKCKPLDLVYFDPPYDGTFTDYTKHTFRQQEQIELKEEVDKLTLSNVYCLISNSDTEFIRDLYKEYVVYDIDTKYSVGGTRSDKKKELLITNQGKVVLPKKTF